MATSDYRLAALLSCEMSVDRLADSAAHNEAVSAFDNIVRRACDQNGGDIVKRVGETFLLSFTNAQAAVQCAVSIQRSASAHNSTGSIAPLHLRIGAHLGEVHFFESDAIGDVVAVVSRLQALARPGAICISEDVYRLVSGKTDTSFERIGTLPADNALPDSVNAYEAIVVPGSAGGDRPGSEERAAGGRPEAERWGGERSAADGEHASGRGSGSGGDGGADDRRLKELAFAEIKRAGRRLSIQELENRLPGSPEQVSRVLNELADKGFLTRLESNDGRSVYASMRPRVHIPDRRGSGDEREDKEAEKQWDAVLSPEYDEDENDTVIEEYVEQTAEAADKAAAGFRGHLTTYVGVNALLFLVYMTTSAGGFPWFLIPLTAWGIGIATHAGTVAQRKREKRELRQMQRPTRKQIRLFRKLTKARNAFSSHLISNVATSGFLAALNLLVSPGFFWAIFPIGGMGIGLLSHYPAFKSKERRILDQLKEAGGRFAERVRGSEPGRRSVGRSGAAAGGSYSERNGETAAAGGARRDPGAEAERLRQQILEQLNRIDTKTAPFGDEIQPVLDDYVSQVTQLADKQREIAEIVDSIPIAELERDLQELSKKRREAQNDRMAAEYDRSIEQILKQKRSFEELKNEQEVLALRLRSGLNTLKQMQIDLVRMHSLSSGRNTASTDMLREKASELSNYLKDLEKGYAELG